MNNSQPTIQLIHYRGRIHRISRELMALFIPDLSLRGKVAYHYLQEEGSGFYVRVEKYLKPIEGFNSKFFTHFWKNAQRDDYLFVYEYEFLSKMENGKKKYILVMWQPHMESI